MTHTLKPYPTYKPSGIEWLREVPAHWDVLPNRAIFAEVNEQNRQIVLEKMIQQAIGAERKRELALYKRYANDPEFKRAFNASIGRFLQSAALSQYFEDVADCQPAPVPDTERVARIVAQRGGLPS